MVSIAYSNQNDFVDLHTESIIAYCKNNRRKFQLTKLNNLTKKYFLSVVSDFEGLVKATPKELKEIKRIADGLNKKDKGTLKKEFNVKRLYGYFVSNVFNENSQGVEYNSVCLAKNSDIFTCPYCNENFVYSFQYDNGKKKLRRTFDWDHFYSQNDYPFLAVSFFNLVPSCKICNHVKLDQNGDFFNPHDNINVDNLYWFNLKPLGTGFISDKSKVKLSIIVKKNRDGRIINNTMRVNGLLSRMNCHKDLVIDILNRKRMFPDVYLESMKKNKKWLSRQTIAMLKETLYGIKLSHQHYYRRPFSKLIGDILRNKKI